jgi:hypothetical protein
LGPAAQAGNAGAQLKLCIACMCCGLLSTGMIG